MFNQSDERFDPKASDGKKRSLKNIVCKQTSTTYGVN